MLVYIKDKINPHHYIIHNHLPEHGEIFEFNAENLIWDRRRFDLAVKFTYLTQKNNHPKLDWPNQIYKEHIKAFSNGTFSEGDGSKHCYDDFVKNFEELELAFQESKFDASLSLIPFKNGINTDGAHRISLAAFYKQTLKGVSLEKLSEPNYNYQFFRNKNQPSWINDFVFLQHILANEDMRIIHIHPKANITDDEVLAILAKHNITLAYDKALFLSKFAHGLVVRELYKDEKWIGNYTNQFKGAFEHAAQSYRSKKPLRVFFINESDVELLRTIKDEIRAICNIGNYSVHINDTYQETVDLAKIFLNEQSIQFLNSCFNNQTFWKTDELLTKLTKDNGNKNTSRHVIVGSFPLSLIGLRENRDLDIICADEDFADLKKKYETVDCHNVYLKQFDFDHNEILSDPRQSFFWQQHNFLTLDNVWKLKKLRKERKDYVDSFIFWCLKHTSLNTNTIYQKIHQISLNPKVIGRKILGNYNYEMLKKTVGK